MSAGNRQIERKPLTMTIVERALTVRDRDIRMQDPES